MRKILKITIQYILAIFLSLVVALLLRIFAVDFYSIPSDSMEPALEPGDFILVNKLYHGARMYRNFDFMDSGGEPETYRIKGFSSIHRNDVVVFNFPYAKKWDTIRMNLSRFYVKRCIAIPGDTLRIVNGFYNVNGNTGYGNMEAQEWLSSMDEAPSGIRYTIPFHKNYSWDVQNFGPLLIPRQGDTLGITTKNIVLYRKLLIYETKGKITQRQGVVFLNGQPITGYRFRSNWYFMAGDNVLNSQDCRYIGPIPEEFIVGKASLVLTSKDKESEEYKWKRFFKRIK